jgi:hypothetical protein
MTDANAHPNVRIVTVGHRVYRKAWKSDRRRRPAYVYPELKLSNAWLRAAGFGVGDRVVVVAVEPGLLAVKRLHTHGSARNAPDPAVPQLPTAVRL